MTKDDIVKWAREAGYFLYDLTETHGKKTVETDDDDEWEVLARFAALVAAAEREACAKLAEQTVCDTHLPTGVKIYGTRVAKAIRSRT
jgi:hypothetical protein